MTSFYICLEADATNDKKREQGDIYIYILFDSHLIIALTSIFFILSFFEKQPIQAVLNNNIKYCLEQLGWDKIRYIF